jgi:translation initiation factor 2B subunit (eIF-2B alpha/beta/delta family)
VKRVKLITGLQIEEVVAYNPQYVQVAAQQHHSFSSPDRSMLATIERKVHVVPIKHYVENWVALSDEFKEETRTEEGYIAASPETDEVLGKYLRCCHNEITWKTERIADLEDRKRSLEQQCRDFMFVLNKYRNLTFWQRLKFLFKWSIYE